MNQILIVDDEPLALRRLRRLLIKLGVSPDHIALASGVGSAVAHLKGQRTDIVLLDIKMRDGTGFDVISQMPEGVAPAIIFVTAFDDFAVRAFEIAAADYVVKPVSLERLGESLERAQHLLKTRSPARRSDALARVASISLNGIDSPPDAWATEFWIRRAGGELVRIEVTTIDCAVVEEDYVRIFSGERSDLIRESIRGLTRRLDPEQFVQIHRTALIRRSEIAEVTRSRIGGAEIKLRSGRLLPLGRVHGKVIKRHIREAAE